MSTTPTPGPVEVELKPCPFCGGSKILVSQTIDQAAPNWYVACHRTTCAFTGYSSTEAEAITAWNTRHRIEALADAAAEAEPVGYIIAEMLNRRREYESNGIVMTATPQGMSTLPLYTAPSSQRALVEALEVFRSFGCPVCNGDCSGANAPVMTCPMQMADRALSRAKATGDGL